MAYGVVNPSFSGLSGGGGMQALGAGSLILGLGGMLSSTIGSFFSADAKKYELKTQAIIADTNARIAELGAQTALNQGQQEIGNLTLKAGQLKSTQRVSMAANGIDLGEGNAAEVLASTEIMKEVDKNTLQANAVRSAWGYRMQGTNFQNEALTARNTSDAISPWATGFTSLLGGAGKVADRWYSLNKEGALNGTPFALGG